MVYVTRKAHFAAAHRLYNPSWSMEENYKVFGKCNNPSGHGHNYNIEVTVAGMPPAETGMVIDLKVLAEIVDRELIELVDHKHLNVDVPFLTGIIPTAENMAMAFWKVLAPKIPFGTLYSIKLYESENNLVEYRGE
ncbi:MAG: 6-carboxytetrahydropterin synthase [Ignavibacteriae bacterium]|nr:6-carboxytetrahydropterin synthase [Ignavibacteriota bacterium]